MGEFDGVPDFGGAAEKFDLIFFGFKCVTHGFGEKSFGAVGPYGGELDTVESMDGDFGGGVVPGDLGIGEFCGFDEFDLEPIVVLESEDGEAEAFFGGEGDAGS